MEAVKAVFRCWDNPRAIVLPPHERHPRRLGHRRQRAGHGLRQHRRRPPAPALPSPATPATGEKKLYGEYLMNAQGEDVVAGIRTPSPSTSCRSSMPEVYQQFVDIAGKLEDHYRDMQDMEFTIENGKLYMLQTRNGKRTAAAALKIACRSGGRRHDDRGRGRSEGRAQAA